MLGLYACSTHHWYRVHTRQGNLFFFKVREFYVVSVKNGYLLKCYFQFVSNDEKQNYYFQFVSNDEKQKTAPSSFLNIFDTIILLNHFDSF